MFCDFAAGAAGRNVVTNIQTSQANNEEVRIYALLVNITDGAGGSLAAGAADVDFNVQLTVNLTTFLLMLSTSCLHF